MKYTKKEQIQYQKQKIQYHAKRLKNLGLTKMEIIEIIKKIT